MLHDSMLRMISAVWRPSSAALGAGLLALGLTGAASAAQTLPVWDDYTFEAQSKVVDQLIQKFQAAHPDVTIKRTARTFDDLAMTLKLTVSSGEGPAVTKVNQGAGDMGAMAKAKLLEPVDAYITKYGWDKRQSDSVLARDRWSDTGQFGEGKTYGISGLGEMVGLYYNKKLLDSAGVTTPIASFDDFKKALDAVKAKGIAPFMIGTAKNHMALHMLATLSQANIDAANRKELDDLIYDRGGTWKTKGNLDAAKQILDWAKNGYFYNGYQGISGDDAIQLFISGQGAFAITGTWYLGDTQNNPDLHFMAMPAPAGVKAPLTVGGVDLAWSITSLAKDDATKDLAGQYLDYMVSDEAAEMWAAAGYLPAVALKDPSKIKMSGVLTEAIGVWNKITADNALGHYPDWATPTMLKTFDDNLPAMLADKLTPEAFVDSLEKDYTTYLASLKK